MIVFVIQKKVFILVDIIMIFMKPEVERTKKKVQKSLCRFYGNGLIRIWGKLRQRFKLNS